MKRTINAGIGKRNFVMDEDAYARLETFLGNYRSRINAADRSEVMDVIEERIADLFTQETNGSNTVVDINLVNRIIAEIGMPDGEDEFKPEGAAAPGAQSFAKPKKKLYRDTDDKMLGGVCSGLAAYFNTDVVIIRILFVALFICASAGFWAYLIFWIVAPQARTAAEKCEMRGLAPTYENLSQFTNTSK